jgi:hypothetical protein
MSATPSTILTDEHFALFNNALAQAAAIQREIDLAKQAGIDVSKQQARLADFLDKNARIKQVYFPGR